MSVKKLVIVLIVAALIIAVSGCTAAATTAETTAAAVTTAAATTAAAETTAAATEAAKVWKIGFNNYADSHEFCAKVSKGIRDEAAKAGVELEYTEAMMDGAKMVANTQTLIDKGCDLIIDFNWIPEVGATMLKMCNDADVKLISMDTIYEGTYYFGANSYIAGQVLGEAVGHGDEGLALIHDLAHEVTGQIRGAGGYGLPPVVQCGLPGVGEGGLGVAGLTAQGGPALPILPLQLHPIVSKSACVGHVSTPRWWSAKKASTANCALQQSCVNSAGVADQRRDGT